MHCYNIVLIGCPETGKTKWLDNLFGRIESKPNYIPTVGFTSRSITIPKRNGYAFVTFTIYDLGGHYTPNLEFLSSLDLDYALIFSSTLTETKIDTWINLANQLQVPYYLASVNPKKYLDPDELLLQISERLTDAKMMKAIGMFRGIEEL